MWFQKNVKTIFENIDLEILIKVGFTAFIFQCSVIYKFRHHESIELIAIGGKAAYVDKEASVMTASDLEVVGDGEGGISRPW